MTNEEMLFAGAAPYYAKYRAPYPDALIADIVSQFSLDVGGRLLDLGCGPGTLTFPLSPHFAQTVALDPNAEMIAEGRGLDSAGGIDWRVMAAEDISPDLGTFRLVTCGSSFHWMDRDLVLAKVEEMLEPGGGMALAAGISAWWDGQEDWHRVVTEVVRRYLGDVRRAGRSGFAKVVGTAERFEQTLERNGWRVEFYRDYETVHTWDIDWIVGHLWSTSFAGRVHFGERVDQFERELRAELAALRPDGVFRETGMSGLVCGRPGAAG